MLPQRIQSQRSFPPDFYIGLLIFPCINWDPIQAFRHDNSAFNCRWCFHGDSWNYILLFRFRPPHWGDNISLCRLLFYSRFLVQSRLFWKMILSEIKAISSSEVVIFLGTADGLSSQLRTVWMPNIVWISRTLKLILQALLLGHYNEKGIRLCKRSE